MRANVGGCALSDSWSGHNQRDAGRTLIERHDDGVVQLVGLLEGGNQAANPAVEVAGVGLVAVA